MLIIKVRSEPVEDGHEVVANALDAIFAQTTNIFGIVGYQSITRGLAEFDIFVYGNGFDNFHFKPCFVAKLL